MYVLGLHVCQQMYRCMQACSQKTHEHSHTRTHTCCITAEVLTVSEMRAEGRGNESPPPRQRQNEIDSQMQLKEIGGGFAVETASFVVS